MSEPVILWVKPLDEPVAGPNGRKIVAHFGCEIAGVKLMNCGLTHRIGKGWQVISPGRFTRLSNPLRSRLRDLVRAELAKAVRL